MSDTAWISLAVIVVAVCILIVVLATRRMKKFRLRFPVPFLKDPFDLSPHDSKAVHQENLMRCNVQLFETFLKLTKRGDGVDQDAVRSTDAQVLRTLVNLNLLHADGERLEPSSIRLGYLGWQALENYLRQNKISDKPKMEPWNWPENFPR